MIALGGKGEPLPSAHAGSRGSKIDMNLKIIEVSKVKLKSWRRSDRLARGLGIRSLPLEMIKKRRSDLNSSKFKSEMWFKDLLIKEFKMHKITVHRNFNILNRFFADFFIVEKGIVIEIDGSSHQDQVEYDKRRDRLFAEAGYSVIRVKAYDNSSAENALNALKDSLRGFELQVAIKRKKVAHKERERRRKEKASADLEALNKRRNTVFCPSPETFKTPMGNVFLKKYSKAWKSYHRAGLNADAILMKMIPKG